MFSVTNKSISMENNNQGSMRDEDIDWLFVSQNPTGSSSPAFSAVNGGSAMQDRRHSYIVGSSSTPPVNGTGGFLVNNGAFSLHDRHQQQQLSPARNQSRPNPVRSILDHYNSPLQPDYCHVVNPYYNSGHPDYYHFTDFHPTGGVANFDHRSSINGFSETLYDRNLETKFSRLNLSSPNRNNPFTGDSSFDAGNIYPQGRFDVVKRGNGCNGACCNRFSNHINPIRPIDSISDSNHHLPQSRQQQQRRDRFPASFPANFPSSLKDLQGLIYHVAKNQDGCKFLQTKCEEGKPEEIEMIFTEIKDRICELMMDPSMNYLTQKLFSVCNERQMNHIVDSVTKDVTHLNTICLNSHGTRAMQKLIEVLQTNEQKSRVLTAIRRITVDLTKNMNGHHVIQQCLKSLDVDKVQPILNVVADNCLDIATDKSGCCVLQQCVLHAVGVSKERLLTEIVANALHLSEHPYGNYVVQHILGLQMPEVTAGIMQRLLGNYVMLSMNKYGSNVVEKCLKDAKGEQATLIIKEIINSPNFLSVLQHPYGNYVAQSALEIAKGSLKETMINLVQKEYAFLHSHPHGKRVLALARNSKPKVQNRA